MGMKPRRGSNIREKQSREDIVYEEARHLASLSGISYSEALGFVLCIENPTYGWEQQISEEAFQELIEKSCLGVEEGRDAIM